MPTSARSTTRSSVTSTPSTPRKTSKTISLSWSRDFTESVVRSPLSVLRKDDWRGHRSVNGQRSTVNGQRSTVLRDLLEELDRLRLLVVLHFRRGDLLEVGTRLLGLVPLQVRAGNPEP